jgi:hypothetical protein
MQAPAWQALVIVHGLPSSQLVPSSLLGFEQEPVIGLHAPASWHWSSAAHAIDAPTWQAPPWHVSFCVQRSPSVQGLPSALAGSEHTPVAGSQTPAS